MRNISNTNILIADDDEGMLRAMTKVFAEEGANVISTSEAGDVLNILTRTAKHVDLVITDLQMPQVTGLTLMHQIHQAFPQLPIVVLTAFGSPLVKSECEREGAKAFLEKPVDSRELLAAVKGVLPL